MSMRAMGRVEGKGEERDEGGRGQGEEEGEGGGGKGGGC